MFIEINRGRSFRGLSQYCLHDVNAKTCDRVEFVETRNVATDNPQVAWRIMASRSYVQDELKEEAGVKSSGRKNGKPVGHMLISWGREEADAQELGREIMLKTAEGALAAIGATKHQAMIVAHNDTADRSPHCHVIINLIGDDGRLKKNWKEREKLSRFALEEEIRVHGKPIVKERQKRWHDRDAGETPAPMKKKARHLYEIEKAAEQDNQKGKAKRLLAQQKEIEQKKESQQARQQRNRERLREIMEERERRIKAQCEALTRQAKTNTRKLYNESWQQLHEQQQLEWEQFNEREKGIRGSIENGLRLVDWFTLFKRPHDTGQESIKDLFQILTNETRRREVLQHRHELDLQSMREEQRKTEQKAIAIAEHFQDQRLQDIQAGYIKKAEHMKLRQNRNGALLKDAQQEITRERNEQLKLYRQQELERKRQQSLKQKIQREFNEASVRVEAEEHKEEGGKTGQGSGDLQLNPVQKRRERKPRDPKRSRRKRDIAKREQQAVKNPEDKQSPVAESDSEFDARLRDQLNENDRGQERDFDR